MMNVHDNIAYGLRCNGVAKADISAKVDDVLQRVALPDVGKRKINQLSGGQKQRIAIARCMALDPDVLLLDEPLGALDLKLREAMKIELKLLQHQFDTTFVSDNVAVMNEGRFEQIGTPQALYHEPASSFVAGFVGDANQWSGVVDQLGNDQVSITTESGLRINGSMRGASDSNTGTATVYVRPEFIQVRSGTDEPVHDSDNHLPGTIDSLLFNGANSRVLVRDNTGQLIEADVTLTGGLDDPRPGDTVTLSWSPRQTMCF